MAELSCQNQGRFQTPSKARRQHKKEDAMLFICYPRCSTCKTAQDWLLSQGRSFIFRDIKEETPSLEELAAWHKKSGLPLRRFFNTSGLSYRALGLKDKLDDMPMAEQLALLASDGMLIKRPLLVGEGFVLAGFREKEWQEALLG